MSLPRHQLPGAWEFAELPDGVCHYITEGEGDDVILLIHGATVPAWEFDRIVPLITAEGFRTLRADLFGHGYSDRPETTYDVGLFSRQLTGLMDLLEIGGNVRVLGHSLGAVVACRMAAENPGRFSSLTLAAPLVDFTANIPLARLLQIPFLGELMMSAYVVPMLVRRRTRRYRSIGDGRFVGKFRDQFLLPGFGSALLRLFRDGALGDQRGHYRALARESLPVLVIRGSRDKVARAAQVRELNRLVPHARFHEFPGASHAFLLTDPEMVAPVVSRHFRESRQTT